MEGHRLAQLKMCIRDRCNSSNARQPSKKSSSTVASCHEKAKVTPAKTRHTPKMCIRDRIDRASVVLRRLFLCGFCILPDLIRRVCLISRAFFLFRKRICQMCIRDSL